MNSSIVEPGVDDLIQMSVGQIIPGASHLFEEPGKLVEVARLAAAWFRDKCRRQRPA